MRGRSAHRPFRRLERIGHQHGDGHFADPSGNRRDRAGDLRRLGSGHVADEARLRLARRVEPLASHPIDADVDDDRAGLHPRPTHHFRPPDRGDENVGAARDGGQIAGARMGDRHRAMAREQELRHRLADDVRAADDDSLHAGEHRAQRLAGLVEHDHRAGRRAGHERPAHLADRKQADIDRMEAVDVLLRVDRLEHPRRTDVPGQRQLHQNAVHRRIGVERLDEREQFGFARLGGERVLHRMKAAALGGSALAGDIGLARRVFADEHDREARRHAALGQRSRLCRDRLDHALRHRLAVEHERPGHRLVPLCFRPPDRRTAPRSGRVRRGRARASRACRRGRRQSRRDRCNPSRPRGR